MIVAEFVSTALRVLRQRGGSSNICAKITAIGQVGSLAGSVLAGHAAVMSNADEISDVALRLVGEAAEQMIAFLRNESLSLEAADEAFMLLIRQFMASGETGEVAPSGSSALLSRLV